MPSHASRQTTMEPEALHTPENIDDLARIIASEARGLSETAQATVGWTVVNRMKKHNLVRVSEVWANSHYVHGHFPTATSLRPAESILGGTAMYISQGATHFYTPGTMPKLGESHSGIDIGRGLESTPGIHENGQLVQNYRSHWTTRFPAVRTPAVQEKDFRFYREP